MSTQIQHIENFKTYFCILSRCKWMPLFLFEKENFYDAVYNNGGSESSQSINDGVDNVLGIPGLGGTSFEVKMFGGLIDITTHNGEYYYKIKKPKEIWGNYFTKVSFYHKNGRKIYYHSKVYVHSLPPYNLDNLKLNFVCWSPGGNKVLIYEFLRSKVYELKVIDLKNKISYGVDLEGKENQFINDVVSKFSKFELTWSDLQGLGFVESTFYNDKIFFWKKWLP